MNWLKDNPIGLILVSFSSVFALISVVMTIVWTMPVKPETTGLERDEIADINSVPTAREAIAMSELQVINERPVFNVSRLPVVAEVEDDSSEAEEETSIAVAEAPDVRLTGVIITPDMKIATMTPANEALENVMAYEGQSLIGEYVGWKVGKVNPRTVVLNANNGRQLKLDLQVHEANIKEPPKPVTVVESEPAEEGEVSGEDGQPLSRAEQIRQRIAERREELRIQQEGRQVQETQGNGRSAYQNAIQQLIQKKSKDQGSDDNNDG